jgi:hypothetical protein
MAAAAPVTMPQLGVLDGGDRKTAAARAAEAQVWIPDGCDRALAARAAEAQVWIPDGCDRALAARAAEPSSHLHEALVEMRKL